MVKNVAAGLGRNVNTHATSNDTLVLDDVHTASAHKVIQGVSFITFLVHTDNVSF